MKIYFIGICGTATGNVAILLKNLGNEVCGSDSGIYEPMKSALANANIDCLQGWAKTNLENFAPDLIVVGNAISRMNPELEFALEVQKYKMMSLPEVISAMLIANRKSLVISGTHGKTTTTSIASFLLKHNNSDTGWLIGGIPQDLQNGSNLGDIENAPFVIEGDEYDSAFFDKRSKFLHYKPHILVINNIEFDHADIFRDLYDVKRTFTHVRRIVSPKGVIIENGDDENIASLEPTPWCGRMTVGFAPTSNLRIEDFSEDQSSSSFTLSCCGVSKKVSWALTGVYNARNAAMAIAGAALVLGKTNPLDIDISALSSFKGVRRRQQVILDRPNIVVIEDFAHHPTAIKLTIDSLRARYKDFEIHAAFEPRSNTAKTNTFENEFSQALASADFAYLGAIYGMEKIPLEKRLNTQKMAEICKGKFKAYADNMTLLSDLLKLSEDRQKQRLFVFFSNGAFDNIHKDFADKLLD